MTHTSGMLTTHISVLHYLLSPTSDYFPIVSIGHGKRLQEGAPAKKKEYVLKLLLKAPTYMFTWTTIVMQYTVLKQLIEIVYHVGK